MSASNKRTQVNARIRSYVQTHTLTHTHTHTPLCACFSLCPVFTRTSCLQVELLLAGSGEWQYDTWALAEASGGHALSVMGFYLMQREGLVTTFKLQPIRLARCVYGACPSVVEHTATVCTYMRARQALMRSFGERRAKYGM